MKVHKHGTSCHMNKPPYVFLIFLFCTYGYDSTNSIIWEKICSRKHAVFSTSVWKSLWFSILWTSACSITSLFQTLPSLEVTSCPLASPLLSFAIEKLNDRHSSDWQASGRMVWEDSWLNVEHSFYFFLLCVACPSYFFNCWPCGNWWLLPRASVVRVTAECISSTESSLSMDATLSAANTPQTTHYRDLRSVRAS